MYEHDNEKFYNACKNNDKELTKRLLNENSIHSPDNFLTIINNGLCGACEEGHIDIVELLLFESAHNAAVREPSVNIDYDNGLYEACCGGHIEIVKLMINKGATDLSRGLQGACYGGHKEIVELIIPLGALNYSEVLNFDWALSSACYNNHKELALMMVIKGADIRDCFIELNFEDIYYLSQAGIKNFGEYSYTALECQKFKQEFQNTVNDLFIKDVANIITQY